MTLHKVTRVCVRCTHVTRSQPGKNRPLTLFSGFRWRSAWGRYKVRGVLRWISLKSSRLATLIDGHGHFVSVRMRNIFRFSFSYYSEHTTSGLNKAAVSGPQQSIRELFGIMLVETAKFLKVIRVSHHATTTRAAGLFLIHHSVPGRWSNYGVCKTITGQHAPNVNINCYDFWTLGIILFLFFYEKYQNILINRKIRHDITNLQVFFFFLKKS